MVFLPKTEVGLKEKKKGKEERRRFCILEYVGKFGGERKGVEHAQFTEKKAFFSVRGERKKGGKRKSNKTPRTPRTPVEEGKAQCERDRHREILSENPNRREGKGRQLSTEEDGGRRNH